MVRKVEYMSHEIRGVGLLAVLWKSMWKASGCIGLGNEEW